MATQMTERQRHPSTLIDAETVAEISYRVYLLRLEPPMTPEESIAISRNSPGPRGRAIIQDDSTRKAAAKGTEAMTRAYLRVLVDLGLIGGKESCL